LAADPSDECLFRHVCSLIVVYSIGNYGKNCD